MKAMNLSGLLRTKELRLQANFSLNNLELFAFSDQILSCDYSNRK